MDKIDEKTIMTQVKLNIDLLEKLVLANRTETKETISNFIANWQKDIGWDKDETYSIVNQGVLLTHLYGLIVYPKEIFINEIPDQLFVEFINKKEWGKFRILNYPKKINSDHKMELKFFVRKIRNAISHATVEITNNMTFIFEDTRDGTKIEFGINDLLKFVNKFGTCCIHERWS
jgi:hypothetical protein